mmetsp:Transcript_37076/g.88729  ORF Transcript_37076/g.88729 Transcript_37076/m.88729 type:complete len:252 (-) Transcript_37076:451-1206(-)
MRYISVNQKNRLYSALSDTMKCYFSLFTTALHSIACLLVNSAHENSQVDQSVGVAPLVIIPGDDLVECIVEGDACRAVNNTGSVVVDKILGDNGVVSVAEDTLEFITLRGSLERGEHLILCASLLQLDGKINHGNIGGRASDGHTGQNSVQLGDDLANGLSSSGGGRDEVGNSGTSTTPVLSSPGGSINNKLSGSGGMDGRHETLLDTVNLVDNLGERGQAVGRARRVGNYVHGALVLLVVNSHDKHWGVS